MDFLHPEFEKAITPLLDGKGVAIGRFSYTAADILKLAGENAYKQAFNDWIWEDWIPTRQERNREILKLNSNDGRIHELKQMIASGHAIPFVGSGMSCPTGMPTWGKFLRETCKQTKGFKVADLDALLSVGDFETAASRIFCAMPPALFNERFESNFTIKPSRAVDGPVRLLPFLFDSIVITTNFDGVLERVYSDQDKTFQDILHGMSVGDFRRRVTKGSRCLLKLHGNYATPYGRVLLKDEYEAFYDVNCGGRAELSHLFRGGRLLFLGCSLFQDRTMSLLKEIADSDKNMPRHYALLQQPKTKKTLIEREHFLSERHIFPIWYDGAHDVDIESIILGLMEDLGKL